MSSINRRRAPRPAPWPAARRQILPDREMRKEQIVLERDTDAPRLDRQTIAAFAADPKARRETRTPGSGAPMIQLSSVDFARTGDTHQGENLAGRHAEFRSAIRVWPERAIVALRISRGFMVGLSQAAPVSAEPVLQDAGQRKYGQQRHLQQCLNGQDAPIAARAQSNRLGRHRGITATAGEQGRQILRDAHRKTDG